MPAWINIGGKLSRSLLENFMTAIERDGAGPEYGIPFEDGFNEKALLECRHNDVLELYCDQARNGNFEMLEQFCQNHGLDYNRHCDSNYEYNAEMVWCRDGQIVSCQSDNDGTSLVDLDVVLSVWRSLCAGNIHEALTSLLPYANRYGEIPPIPRFEIVD